MMKLSSVGVVLGGASSLDGCTVNPLAEEAATAEETGGATGKVPTVATATFVLGVLCCQ